MEKTIMGNETSGGILLYYEALEGASHRMLAAARAGDWDGVCRLEGACTVVIAKLRRVATHRALEPREQEQRIRILRTILTNDAEIRRICDPLPASIDPRAFSAGEVSLALH